LSRSPPVFTSARTPTSRITSAASKPLGPNLRRPGLPCTSFVQTKTFLSELCKRHAVFAREGAKVVVNDTGRRTGAAKHAASFWHQEEKGDISQ